MTAGLIVLFLGLGVAGALAWFGIMTLRERKAARAPKSPPPMTPPNPTSPIAPFERHV